MGLGAEFGLGELGLGELVFHCSGLGCMVLWGWAWGIEKKSGPFIALMGWLDGAVRGHRLAVVVESVW